MLKEKKVTSTDIRDYYGQKKKLMDDSRKPFPKKSEKERKSC